jgi:hypothetical protein
MATYNEFVENMNYAREHCGGEFNVIVARNKDTRADRPKIKEVGSEYANIDCLPAQLCNLSAQAS